MKWLVLDTETSGLPDFRAAADAPGQPHVCDLALIYLDEEMKVEREEQFYIQPDGWEIEPGAAAIHGLTEGFLWANGVTIGEALDVYVAAILGGRALVGHNCQFDAKMMRGELRRAGIDDMFEETRTICTMRGAAKLPALTGRPVIKYDAQGRPTRNTGWPKLPDLCRYLDVPLPLNAHGARDDAIAAADCFRAMVALGFDATPEVHYARART